MIARRKERGFTLIEALVALTVIALALLLGLAAISQHRTAIRVLEARGAALEATEAVLESLRTGAVALEPGPVRWLAAPPVLQESPELQLRLALEVLPLDLPGLTQVTVVARFNVLRKERVTRHPTLVWSG